MLSNVRLRAQRGICAAFAALIVAAVASAAPAPAAESADPLRFHQWSLDVIGQPPSSPSDRGAGIVVAVVDTGVDLAHEDLAGHLVAGHDFVDDDDVAQDQHGHGTHVAGIVAATSVNGRGISGVAPAARIMPVRVLDENGEGNSGDVIAGMRWAADHGANVVNLSLADFGRAIAGSLFDAEFSEALNYVWSKGAIPVVAAGNESFFASGYAEEPALIVTATDRRDAKASYASPVGSARWGMAAPGGGGGSSPENGILSTYLKAGTPNAYAVLSGTSMAAPHVAGAAAVLRAFGRSPQETVDVLQATALDLGAAGRDSTFGAGRLDLAAALRAIGAPASPAPAAAASAPAKRSSTPRSSAAPRTTPAQPTTSRAPAPAAPTTEAPVPTAVTEPTAPSRDAGEATPFVAPRDEVATSTPTSGPRRRGPAAVALLALAGVAVAAALSGRRRALPRR